MSKGLSAMQDDMADPDIRRFVDAINASYVEHGAPAGTSMSARRAVAERVRRPWREGGPIMAESHEMDMGGVRLRLHRPVADATLPVMLYIHGGGWTLFSIDTHDRLMREYAAGADMVVVAIDYSLSPEARFPAALHEVIAVVDWLKGNAADLGIDPGRIAIGGDSAGANLALSTCLALRDRGSPGALAGMLLNYGFFDADFETASQKREGGPGGMLTSDELAGFLDDYLGPDARRDDPLALPALAQLHDLPPSFHVIAERDPLADGDVDVARRMAAAGNAVDMKIYAGATHSFLEAMSISALARQAIGDSADWLRRTLAHHPVRAA